MSDPKETICHQGPVPCLFGGGWANENRSPAENETVWLTQQNMADLFQTTKQNVSLHLQNIFAERELDRGATVKNP